MEAVANTGLTATRQFLRQLSLQVSDLVRDWSAHIFIGNMISNLPDDQRSDLKNLMNSFLSKMHENNASDIDLGGLRIAGKNLVQDIRSQASR